MWVEIWSVFKHAIMITGFVFVMMLVIEYINVQTAGVWQTALRKWKWGQYIITAFMGIIPGCLGAFTVVALYSHRVISLGALAAAMIATSGDEAFVMLAMFPGKAVLLTGIIFLLGIITGYLTDRVIPEGFVSRKLLEKELPLHRQDQCTCYPKGEIWQQIRHISMERALLVLIIILLFAGFFSGVIGPGKWNWIRVTILTTMTISLFIVSTVPGHFLKEHLWDHVVKIHTPKIFLWTFGTLLIFHILMQYINLENLVAENLFIILIIAVTVGIIPESGPHLVFVTLFFNGTIPFSILLASSIVQDGHGMIPLLAESKRSFIMVKLINILLGLLVGSTGIIFGF